MSRLLVLMSNLEKICGKLFINFSRQGVTIILTTHYIEEAEEIAEEGWLINNGELLLVETKDRSNGESW